MMMESGYVDDAYEEKAARIGQALAAEEMTGGNWFESAVVVCLSEELTVRETRDIAHRLTNGVGGRIELQSDHYDAHLELDGNVLQPLIEVAIQHCSEVQLRFHMNNDIAETLCAALLRLPNNGANHTLQKLELCIGPNMTMHGSQHLAIGLRHAKPKSLKLDSHGARVNSVVSTIYQAMDSVEKLVLRDDLNDDTATAIGNALSGNISLQSFEVKLVDDLSTDAAIKLANGLSRTHIIHLNIRGKIISEGVEDVLYEGLARSPTICHLSLGDGFCGTPGLAQCVSRLHSLAMRHDSIKMEHLPTLIMGLRNAPRLTSLVLGHNFCTPQDITCFCGALPHLTSLTDLTMCCKLAFEERHDGDDNDESVDHESRRIQAVGAEQIMVAVANHPSLIRLKLKSCSDIGYAGIAMIGMHLPNIKLKELYLDIFDDCFSLDVRNKWVKRAYQRACQAMVTGLQSNWRLQVLTRYPPKVEDEIKFYLDLNKSGRYLIHDGESEKVPTGLWCHIIAKCGNNAGFVYYHLREQPTLLLAAGMCHNKLDGKVHGGPCVSVSVGTKRRLEE